MPSLKQNAPVADPTPADRSYPKPVPLVPLPDRGRDAAPLPAQLSSFVGRAQEVAAVAALLREEEVRLVTLIGPGGVGKTRLALHVTANLASHFADGVAFADLSPVRDPELVASTVAHALSLLDTRDRSVKSTLSTHLSAKHLLLVLDNFEHVLGAAPLVSHLLAGCPRLGSWSPAAPGCAFPVSGLFLSHRLGCRTYRRPRRLWTCSTPTPSNSS